MKKKKGEMNLNGFMIDARTRTHAHSFGPQSKLKF